MIKLTKGDEPDVLANNKTAWTRQVLNHIANNEKVPKSLENNYNNSKVKDALRTETKNKCMYCESKVKHITFEHIEHIKPKAKNKFPELTFEFDNLGLACPTCNMNKGAEYDAMTPYINPYVDNPEGFFYCCGTFIWANAGNDRAKLTEIDFDINRPELLEMRGERLKTIRGLIDDYNMCKNPTLKNSLRREIEKEIASDKQYSFMARSFVNQLGI
ncbi:HNH endonuclease [Tenacibaculum mesophilum]|uniref:HNH endonuclease n=1 Tax=Tenacibaculum mesophilum TaxID=104268 RepID=A0AAE9MMT9_9FLAO|nr:MULTISPECIES: HNH endonuclease signature motif containing protein [Tenacibaculum]MCO7185821.1 HNH endonuclease [Tenacibaculum sp. XPcli2-G]UTD14934.1 HNH endonuclease [Tenacibaculum mesophilum]